MFTIQHGQLLCDAHPFFCVGFNYHPSPTGCQYWQEWDATRIEADLRKMAELGFNTVRFFVFWADFEPAPGRFDEEKVAHLKEFIAIAQRYHMYCIPALMTILMNGESFDLAWRDGRDLWRDPDMLAYERAYVRHLATALRDAGNILAYDLGDEIIHVDFASAQFLTRDMVNGWQEALSNAIREAHPGALVLQGNEASAVFGKHQFRPENSQALDLIAIHGYPVWSSLAIESIASYKASCYVPFLAAFSRTYGPVLVDELGCYGGDEEITRDYLRATTYSSLANGACGVIAWCWQDFTSRARPYDTHPDERFVGLLDAAGHPKPALPVLQDFAHLAIEQAPLTLPSAPIGIYLAKPQHGTGSANYLQAHGPSMIAAFYAYLLLKRAHLPFEFIADPFALARYQLVLCPSMRHLSLREQEMLADFVFQGGTLYYSAADYLHGFGGEALFGVRLKDFTLHAQEMDHFTWQDRTYPLVWSGVQEGATQIPVLKETTAETLATYPNGSPAFTRRHYGKGLAYYLNAPFEQHLNAPYRLDIAPWHLLYDYLAQEAHIQRELDIDASDVELAIVQRHQHRYAFIINHAPTPLEATLRYHSAQHNALLLKSVQLEGKEVQIISLDHESAWMVN